MSRNKYLKFLDTHGVSYGLAREFLTNGDTNQAQYALRSQATRLRLQAQVCDWLSREIAAGGINDNDNLIEDFNKYLKSNKENNNA